MSLRRHGVYKLTCSVKNRHNERPGDLLPPWRDTADPESDDEKVRAMLRRVEAESMVASSGDVVEGESQWVPTVEGSETARQAALGGGECSQFGGRPTQSMQGGKELTKSQRTTMSLTLTMLLRTVIRDFMTCMIHRFRDTEMQRGRLLIVVTTCRSRRTLGQPALCPDPNGPVPWR